MELFLEIVILTVIFDSVVNKVPAMQEKHWVRTLHSVVDTPLAFLRAFLSYELQELDRLILIGVIELLLLFM